MSDPSTLVIKMNTSNCGKVGGMKNLKFIFKSKNRKQKPKRNTIAAINLLSQLPMFFIFSFSRATMSTKQNRTSTGYRKLNSKV